MNLELHETNYKELIISERIPNKEDPELWEKVKIFVSSYPDAYMVACQEIGEEEKKFHTHIFIQRNFIVHKLTTFRSQIQKLFGKSNQRWDWKLKNKKKTSTVLQMFRYVTKNSNLIANYGENSLELYNQHKGLYEPFKPLGQKTMITELMNNIRRCDSCKEYGEDYCLDDCIDAVVNYYDNHNKVYDLHRMRNVSHTLFYKTHKEELKDKLRRMVLN